MSTREYWAVAPAASRLLELLTNCYEPRRSLRLEERYRGASYKCLVAFARAVEVEEAVRFGWYRLSESIPFPTRHARNLPDELNWRWM